MDQCRKCGGGCKRWNHGCVQYPWTTAVLQSHNQSKQESGFKVHRLTLLSPSQEVKDHGIQECKFFHTLEGSSGFAIMSNKYQFFVLGDSDRAKDDLRFKKMADFPPSEFRDRVKLLQSCTFQLSLLSQVAGQCCPRGTKCL